MTQLTNQQLGNQAIFDKALFGIRNQDYLISKNGDHCAYRGIAADGSTLKFTLKCAVGHCISDEDARLWDCGANNVSGTAIDDMADAYPEIFSQYFTYDQLPLLSKLQDAHDTFLVKPSAWEYEMESIAKSYKLAYTHVEA